jgi:hypothetical protein
LNVVIAVVLLLLLIIIIDAICVVLGLNAA